MKPKAISTLMVTAALVALCAPTAARAERASLGDASPNVPLTVALIEAGGGAQHYDTVTLIHSLAGHLAGVELWHLRLVFGRQKVGSFLSVFNFAVKDIVTTFHDAHIDLNVSPSPDPHDGHALCAALIAQALQPDGNLDVDLLLDHMLSAGAHAHVRTDIARAYGAEGERNFRAVLLQSLRDMRRANHL